MFSEMPDFLRYSAKSIGAMSFSSFICLSLRGFIPLIFWKKHFWYFDVFWYFKLWRIPLCYLFLLFRTFYASIYHYAIDSVEEYSLATDIVMGFTCFKPQYYTRKSSFYLFSMVENPVKPRITKSCKNLDKQDKIDLEKQTLDLEKQTKLIANCKQCTMGKICMSSYY